MSIQVPATAGRRHGTSGASPALRNAAIGAALAALEQRRFAAAEAQARAWAERDAGDIEAKLVLALSLAAQGEARQAAPLLQAVARARPGFAHPCRDVARLCAGAPAVVAAQLRACRQLAPSDPALGYAYADFLLAGGNAAAAAAVLRSLLAAVPTFGPAYNLFGMALMELGDMAGAVAAFDRAAVLDPDEGATWSNLGLALKVEDRFAESLAAYAQALRRAPDDMQIRRNRAVALLRAGLLAEGWADYECRPEGPARAQLRPDRLLPDLDGLDLRGRTVLVWHEDGFGDTLQFARYVPLLAARGARVLAWVPRELSRLIAGLDGVAEVVTGPPATFDWHAPFLGLPRAFATTLATIPAAGAYLHAHPALVAAWNARLPAAPLRVGLVWAGQARPWLPGAAAVDRRRSMSLLTLAPLAAVPGAAFISLQRGPAAEMLRGAAGGMVLHDPMQDAADFADTAAIVANLDAVVSVDTSVAHLAGALGKPVLLLDRYDSCWRWLSGREDSPWYPSLRILRQATPGDWAPVVRRAAAALTAISPVETAS